MQMKQSWNGGVHFIVSVCTMTDNTRQGVTMHAVATNVSEWDWEKQDSHWMNPIFLAMLLQRLASLSQLCHWTSFKTEQKYYLFRH